MTTRRPGRPPAPVFNDNGAARLQPGETSPGRMFAYCRVSTDEQARNGQSLDVQRAQIEAWARQRGKQIDRVIVEPGVNAGIPFNERPEGNKLWAELRRGDALVGLALDRLFRDALDTELTARRLSERQVSLHVLEILNGEDLCDGIGEFFRQIMAAVAQLERRKIGERIRGTKRRQKEAGEYLGGPPPFGWTYAKSEAGGRPKLVQVPEQQKALRRIRQLHAEGLSSHKIAADLKARGLPAVSHVTIRKIVTDRHRASA